VRVPVHPAAPGVQAAGEVDNDSAGRCASQLRASRSSTSVRAMTPLRIAVSLSAREKS
jgi:hypothetical protein